MIPSARHTNTGGGGIFMASGQTSNYGLNQWAAEDKVLREEFNQDNARLDATIPKIVAGTYIGDGTENRTIDLGFTPKLVFVCNDTGTVYSSSTYFSNYHGGLAFPEHPVEGGGVVYLTIVENGFQVTYVVDAPHGTNFSTYYSTNVSNGGYRYVAIG